MAPENKSRRMRTLGQPAAVWREREYLRGKLVDAGVIILRTTGCRHYHDGGCSMCGYNLESDKNVAPADLLKQFDNGMEGLGEIKFLKVYTSGSFLDSCEIPKDVAHHILKESADRGLRLLFESRPEFVNDETLQDALSINEDLEIALGLESANDRVLKYSINKGFSRAGFERAATEIAKARIDLRTYVLLKPPFLTEGEAIADSKETMGFASRFSKVVSLNPVNVQRGTLVERLWRSWAYRPPWLWSVLDVLKTPHSDETRFICEPTGGGKERGAHNCGNCDDTILASIKAYSQTQDPRRLGHPDCECRDIWKSVVELDGFVMGGTADLQRFFRKHLD